MSSSQDKSHEGSAGSNLRSKVEEEEEEEEEEVTVATVGEEGGGDLCVQEAAAADCPGAERGPLESAARRGFLLDLFSAVSALGHRPFRT